MAGVVGITCLRNDGPYCVEWIAHHLAAGFDHMLVLTHDCEDGSDALLDALARTPSVTHLPFRPSGKKSVQWQALQIANDHPLVTAADWVMFFDCDEFLTLAPPLASVQDMIAAMQEIGGQTDAIALPWRFFGSAGQMDIAPGLTPARFTRAAPEDIHFWMAHLFKSLIRPKAFRQLGVHRPRGKAKAPARWLGPSGRRLSDSFAQNDATISLYGQNCGPTLACLNHYSVRSADEFILKRARGLPNHMTRRIDLDYWAERNFNSVSDDRIRDMLPATTAKMAQLLADTDTAARHADCLTFHRQTLARLLEQTDVIKLRWRLSLLGDSTPPSEEQARLHMRRLQMASDTSA